MGSWSMIIKRRNIDFSKGQVLTLNYSEPFAHNYLYRVSVENHNAACHDDG